ncbi:MAG: DUF4062 domain-containing protein, partial [Tannerella sp.]|nr:DUF4062 domain-containing protein [Tannerella sp.]
MKHNRIDKTIRLFISSTFADMERERLVLQRDVFPDLVIYCNERNWQFEAVDLRWGISEELATNQKTMSICLQELERCRTVSPQPNFLILLGQRYGWRPLPEQIPESDALAIISQVNGEEKDLFYNWYRIDENAMPEPVYVLQARHGNYSDYAYYHEQVEEKLLALFDRFADREKIIYHASATEQEIHAGALSVDDAEKHVITYLRELNGIPQNEKSIYDDIPENTHRLTRLKNRMEQHLDNDLIIRGKWTFEEYRSDKFDKVFAETILGRLKKIIDNEIDTFTATAETAHIDSFEAERLRNFVGREQEIAAILKWYESGQSPFLVITGQSGCGKSTLMAEIGKRLKAYPTANVITKYLGIDSESSNGQKILDKLFIELEKIHPLSDDEKKGMTLKLFLYKISNNKNKPVVLLFDALDQLRVEDALAQLGWLPSKPGNNLRIIFSTLAGPCLERLQAKHPTEMDLSCLPYPEACELFYKLLHEKNRKLSESQEQLALQAIREAGCSPLFVKFAAEKTAKWYAYEEYNTFPNSIEGIIDDAFEQMALPVEHGLLADKVFRMITRARRGLANDEILKILALDTEFISELKREAKHPLPVVNGQTVVPPILWSRLYFDMQAYLTVKDSPGGAVIDFYHRKVLDVANKRYLTGDQTERNTCALIARYFQTTWRSYDRRAYDELPWCLFIGQDKQALFVLLSDLDFLAKKAEAGFVHDLLDDYARELVLLKENNGSEEQIRQMCDVRDFVATDVNISGSNLSISSDFVYFKAFNYYEDSSVHRLFCEQVKEHNFLKDQLRPQEHNGIIHSRLAFNTGKSPILSPDGNDIVFIDDDSGKLVRNSLLFQFQTSMELIPSCHEKIRIFTIASQWNLLAAISENEIIIWNITGNSVIIRFPYKTYIPAVSFISLSEQGTMLLAGGKGKLVLFNIEIATTKTTVRTLIEDDAEHKFGKLSADGNFAMFTSDNQLYRISTQTIEKRWISITHPDADNKTIEFYTFDATPDLTVCAFSHSCEPNVLMIYNWNVNELTDQHMQCDSKIDGGFLTVIKKVIISKDGDMILGNGAFTFLYDASEKKYLFKCSFGNMVCSSKDFSIAIGQKGTKNPFLFTEKPLETWYCRINSPNSRINNLLPERLNTLKVTPDGNNIFLSYGFVHTVDHDSTLYWLQKSDCNRLFRRDMVVEELYSGHISSFDIFPDSSVVAVSIKGTVILKNIADDTKKYFPGLMFEYNLQPG